tara:strand:- start:531 stop:980 length:450 start_codon:yes stop_codon:yes gene_type:complete
MSKINSTQTILIVEDSDDDFEVTELAFKEANLINPIIRCDDGQDALDLLYKEGRYSNSDISLPGIILLDLNMPGLDGRKVLRKIKGNERLKEIPVIILTTSNDEKDIDECYKIGANTYIKKPVDMESFVASIKRLKEYWLEIAILPRVD